MTAWTAVLRFWAAGWLWPFADPSTLLPLQAPANSVGPKRERCLCWDCIGPSHEGLQTAQTSHAEGCSPSPTCTPMSAYAAHAASHIVPALQGTNPKGKACSVCTPAQQCLTLAAVQLNPPTACTNLPMQQTRNMCGDCPQRKQLLM